MHLILRPCRAFPDEAASAAILAACTLKSTVVVHCPPNQFAVYLTELRHRARERNVYADGTATFTGHNPTWIVRLIPQTAPPIPEPPTE